MANGKFRREQYIKLTNYQQEDDGMQRAKVLRDIFKDCKAIDRCKPDRYGDWYGCDHGKCHVENCTYFAFLISQVRLSLSNHEMYTRRRNQAKYRSIGIVKTQSCMILFRFRGSLFIVLVELIVRGRIHIFSLLRCYIESFWKPFHIGCGR